ncbi:HlyD family secretion protein [Vibrio maritimus]|uniref:HlyD family secretion protein n=1 Tax=Vibrio maritimus TaxID=990268 RepID=UPI001F3E69A3|nr:HlyD family efflux transporter periplasmic adaptor subunit [Vibrio maritimus]
MIKRSSSTALFRKEVIEAKKNRLNGSIILTPHISLQSIVILFFLSFVIMMIYATQSSFYRKETVNGYLIPKKGIVKIFSGRNGVIDDLFVVEGQKVEQGQPIARILNSQNLDSGVELSAELIKEIDTQIDALTKEIHTIKKVFVKDELRIERQLNQLQRSLLAIEKAKATSQKRLNLKQQRLTNNKILYDKGFLSSTLLASMEEELLEAISLSERLDQEIASISVEIDSLHSQKLALPEQLELKKLSTQRLISELQAKKLELNNQYAFIKKAPETGVVTAIQSTLGSQINPISPILTIIPEDSPLEIELLLPTRSAGFVKIGDPVRIRFDAFPYQKFGLAKGRIINIDKSLLLPTEKTLPIKVDEAVYRVRASLLNQNIHAYGKYFPLKVGMIGNADIIIEKRTLLEWLLEPIYSIKGKLG